jgi:hypothetical protein
LGETVWIRVGVLESVSSERRDKEEAKTLWFPYEIIAGDVMPASVVQCWSVGLLTETQQVGDKSEKKRKNSWEYL